LPLPSFYVFLYYIIEDFIILAVYQVLLG
jgi:hypothetical protein